MRASSTQLHVFELLVAQLSVLAMCARQEGVNSKLRAMDGADDFYRHLIALTSRGQRDKDKYNDDAVALLALAVLAPLVMPAKLGDRAHYESRKTTLRRRRGRR